MPNSLLLRTGTRLGATDRTPQKRRLTLVHITTVPATLGFLRGQLTFMREHGFDVHVVTSPGPALDRCGAEENVETHGVTLHRKITPFRDLVAIWRLHRLFRRVRPDIVHASTPKGGLLGVLAARISAVPVVIYMVRGLPFMGMHGLGRIVLAATERIAAATAHHVIAVSHSLRSELAEAKISPAEKVVVLASGSSNGVDAQRFNPASYDAEKRRVVRAEVGIPNGAVVVGFVGRLVQDKGVVELSAAWSEISKRFPEAWLLVIGDWEERDAVPHDVRQQLQSDPRVRLAGGKSDVAPYYSIMDIVVLPTLREGFPNVPLEAAAMELPVVATSVTGCVDAIVPGETGTLIPPGDAAALASAISSYLSNPDLRRQHGSAARSRVVREFQPQVIWLATLGKYSQWLEAAGILPPDIAA